jgi:hypothetical protein
MKPIDTLSDDEFARLAQRAAKLPDAPAALVRAAIDLWPSSPPASAGDVARSALRLIQAALSFDSWVQPNTALGMRAVASDAHHLLFSALGRDIDLRISPAAEHFAISGQVLGPDEEGEIELTAQSEDRPATDETHTAALDDFGEFRFHGLRVGTYRLTLLVGDAEIALPPINVGTRP